MGYAFIADGLGFDVESGRAATLFRRGRWVARTGCRYDRCWLPLSRRIKRLCCERQRIRRPARAQSGETRAAARVFSSDEVV